MCMDVISDKHWLTENIICLLSNAVKYSNGGAVTILVEHMESVESEVEDDNRNEASATDKASETGLKSTSTCSSFT